VLGRLALVGAGLILGVLALEMCLQVAAWWNVPGRRDVSAHPLADAGRVVCLGDSNTYGLYVGPEKAYPSLLQKLWNDDARRPGVEVINLGYPGNDSSAVRNRLKGALEVHHRDVVTIMIGANDLWTVPEPVPGEPPGASYYRLWHVSRVYRLVSLLWYALREPSAAERTPSDAPFVAVPLGGGSPGWSNALQRNLEDMAARIRRTNAEPILLTYPSDKAAYGDANRVIRSTAASAGIRLIDLTPTFRDRCPGWTCPELFPDQHPTPAGHALVAWTIAASVASPPRTPSDR
jgi:lysophospholipase L1-like esterase